MTFIFTHPNCTLELLLNTLLMTLKRKQAAQVIQTCATCLEVIGLFKYQGSTFTNTVCISGFKVVPCLTKIIVAQPPGGTL